MSTKTLKEIYDLNNEVIEEKEDQKWSLENGGLIKDDIESIISIGENEILINTPSYSMKGDLFKDFNLSENIEIKEYLESL